MILRLGDSGPDVGTMQNKVARLGWPILVDDEFGPLTHAAVHAVQWACTWSRLERDGAYGPVTDAMVDFMIDKGGKISEHFRATEFANHSQVAWDRPDILVDRELVIWCEIVRADVSHREGRDTGMGIASGYRTVIRNAQVGGVPGSTHTTGRAADVYSQVLMISGARLRALGHVGGIGTVDRTRNGANDWWTNSIRHFDTGDGRSWRYGQNGRGNSGGGAYNRDRDRVPVPHSARMAELATIDPSVFDLKEQLFDRIAA